MPVLLMTGENDRLAPPAEIRGVAKRIHAQSPRPDVRFETIAGAGHVCNIEEPEVYNRILLDFLEALRDPEAPISAEPSKRWNNDIR
jgi:pimeloyl-ACP methyl ester carboxylesterase